MAPLDGDNRVEVVYALPDEQVIIDVEYAPGMTALDAVEESGLVDRFPDIVSSELVLGVYGVEVAPGFALQPGDRVEISRPLLADPRDMRRDFITGGRVMGGASAKAPDATRKARG